MPTHPPNQLQFNYVALLCLFLVAMRTMTILARAGWVSTFGSPPAYTDSRGPFKGAPNKTLQHGTLPTSSSAARFAEWDAQTELRPILAVLAVGFAALSGLAVSA